MSQHARILFTWTDLFCILITLTCFSAGVFAVAQRTIAAWLSQTNQLIFIGFVLSIMAFVKFKQAQLLLLAIQAQFSPSTLQNLDGQYYLTTLF